MLEGLFTGGCQCGAIRFEADRVFDVLYCHCHSCRRSSGAPVSISAQIPGDAFRITSGTPSEYRSAVTGGVFSVGNAVLVCMASMSRRTTRLLTIAAISQWEPELSTILMQFGRERDRGFSLGSTITAASTTLGESEGGGHLRFHRIGTPSVADQEVLTAARGEWIGVSVSDDGRYLLVPVWPGSAGDKTRVYLRVLEPEGPLIPVVEGFNAHSMATMAGDAVIIATNWNSPNYRVVSAELSDLSPDSGVK